MTPTPSIPTPKINVAAAVIIDAAGKTLLSLRHLHSHQGGKWEFPGGKFEAGESAEQALHRELKEELGIDIQRTEPFIELTYQYPEKAVKLHVLKVTQFTGKPEGREGQQVLWVSAEKLSTLEFPDANYPILEKLLGLF